MGLARSALTPVVAAVVLGYAVILGWMSWHEDALVYPVDPGSRHLIPPHPALGLLPRRVQTVTSDGVRLVGWVMADEHVAPGALWMLIFHGNGENISNAGRTQHYRALRALGLNLVTFDYRGYGESEGRPSEAGLYRDADAAWSFARDSLGADPGQIVVFGHSLGSAVAVELASRVAARALIIEGSFTSLPDVGRRHYPFLPVRLLARNRFASAEKIGQVAIPKLFLHACGDEVIPLDLGSGLFGLAREPKTFVELRGTHNDAYDADSAVYFGAIARFLR